MAPDEEDTAPGRRHSPPSLLRRLGLVRRRGQATQATQLDYRQRWPTVTTLVEQRSESRFFPDDDQPPKTTKVRALEAAAVPVQWLQYRLESVQDRLETKIDDAQARGQKRPSTAPETGGRASAKPTKPGHSTHPYDTDVVPHTAADDGDSRTTAVQQFETHIFADPPPPAPRKTWRVRLASLTKAPKVARSDTARGSEEALVPRDDPGSPPTSPERRWKSVKGRRPTAYPGKSPPQSPIKAGVGIPAIRELDLLSAPSAKSSPSSVSKKGKAKASETESRTSPSSGLGTPDSPTSRRPSPPLHASSTSSQPRGRLSGARVDLLHIFAGRPTSAGSGVGGATASGASSEHKTQLTPRTLSKGAAHVDVSPPPLGTGGPLAKDGTSPSPGSGTPKAGALRHVLELMKMAPPSRAVSPMELDAEEAVPGPKHASAQADVGTGEH